MLKTLPLAAVAAIAITGLSTAPAHAINGLNGISMNGISMNGLSRNGITRNGISMNGTSYQGTNGANAVLGGEVVGIEFPVPPAAAQ